MPQRCKDCRGYFRVRKGTAMQPTSLGSRKRAVAIGLVASSLKGFSSMELHRDLKIRQPGARRPAQGIPEGFTEGRGLIAGWLEMDEARFGGKRKTRPSGRRAGQPVAAPTGWS